MRVLWLSAFITLIQCAGSKPGADQPPSVPPPQPIPNTSVIHCAQVTTQAQCNYHAYPASNPKEYCAWQNNQCSMVQTCAEITLRDLCDSNWPASFGGCIWLPNSVGDGGTCFKNTSNLCSALTAEGTCKGNPSCLWTVPEGEPGVCQPLCLALTPSGQDTCDDQGFCYWNGQACTEVSSCNNIDTNDGNKCDNFNNESGSCFWQTDPGPASCQLVTQCSDIPADKVDAECSHAFNNQGVTSYCAPVAGQCTGLDKCSAATTSGTCSAFEQVSPLNCQWDVALSDCDPKNTTCGQNITQAECAEPANTALDCYWSADNSKCLVETTCSQNPDSATCEHSQLQCAWNPVSSPAQCAPINTQCGQNATSATCTSTSLHSETCQWDSATNQCVRLCSGYITKSTCNQFPTLCGWDYDNGICEPAFKFCGQNPDEATCDASKLICRWNGSGPCVQDNRSCQFVEGYCSQFKGAGCYDQHGGICKGGALGVPCTHTDSNPCSQQSRQDCNQPYCQWE